MSPLLFDTLPPFEELSFIIAKKIIQHQGQKSFLTTTENEVMNQALMSFSSWKQFINDTNVTTCRVRTMISEQFIPHFFHSNKPCCQHVKLDLTDIGDQVHQLHTINNNTDSPIPTITNNIQEEEIKSQNTDHVPLLDIYHTLEFDMAAMIEQRKLEEYHAQEEEEQQQQQQVTTLSVLDETNEFNLKYLLKGIAENRTKTLLSDRDLRNLLSDVKPHRSKWANDDKIGQEELYEACEKVLLDLKNYSEHSTPFLTKVSKREAPDYFDIIKVPMDLGTVSKKLKSFSYKNKREFGNDLYLIYENCLIYNSDPSSEYRKHAIAMRRKTDRLMSRVPEIHIKEKVLLEDELSGDEQQVTRERSVTQESTIEEMRPLTIETTKESQVIHDEIDIDKGELQNKIWREITKKTRANLTTQVEKQYQFDFSHRLALIRNGFDMEKFSLLEHLHDQPETTKKLMRCSQIGFKRWLNRREVSSIYDEFDFNSEDEEGFDGGFFFSTCTTKQPITDEEDALRTDLFLPEYYLNSGLPDIEGNLPEEYIQEEEDTMPSLDMYPTTQLNINVTLQQNINTLHTIRSIHDKCLAIQHNLPLKYTPMIDIPLNMIDSGTPRPNYTTNKPPLIVPEKACHQMIQRSLVQLLSHAGFETAQTNALNTLTDLVSDYFLNIGKTLRKYIDQHGTCMPFQDIVSLTLQQNGTIVQDVHDYTQNIQRYNTRLNDIQCKLENTYQGLISESIGDTKESSLFEDNNEAFITGLFDEELGEDFFGFKELGLDIEMTSLRVPSKLWFDKEPPVIQPTLSVKQVPTHTPLKYPFPPPFLPTSPNSMIGLLQPWYQHHSQVDTQPTTKKPRYPPVNIKSAYTTTTTKKRILKENNTNLHQDTKRNIKRKKISPEDDLTKAQKKQQKLELKAQKLAEKEQKKKQREEAKKCK